MDYSAHYVKSIKSIDEEMTRLRNRMQELRTEKLRIEERLYRIMAKNGVKEYGGVKIDKIKPKIKGEIIKRKKADKVHDAVTLLSNIGVPDPEGTFAELMATQKNKRIVKGN
jgi:hypothetical protein